MRARVAHTSGAAEFFEKSEWDTEETIVLAFDGSSARLLSDLIHFLRPSWGWAIEVVGAAAAGYAAWAKPSQKVCRSRNKGSGEGGLRIINKYTTDNIDKTLSTHPLNRRSSHWS